MSHLVKMSLAQQAADAESTTEQTVILPSDRSANPNRRWQGYVRHLDRLFSQYKTTGSTQDAFDRCQAAARDAKRRYVYGEGELCSVSP